MQTNERRNETENKQNDALEKIKAFFGNKNENERKPEESMGKNSKIAEKITEKEASQLAVMSHVLQDIEIEGLPVNFMIPNYTTDYKSIVERWMYMYLEIFQNQHHYAYPEDAYVNVINIFVNEIFGKQTRRFGSYTNFVFIPVAWGETQEEFELKWKAFLSKLVEKCGGRNGYNTIDFDELTDVASFNKKELENKAIILIGDILHSDAKNLKDAIEQLEKIGAYAICSYFIAKQE